jgi:hypothetical protein
VPLTWGSYPTHNYLNMTHETLCMFANQEEAIRVYLKERHTQNYARNSHTTTHSDSILRDKGHHNVQLRSEIWHLFHIHESFVVWVDTR